MKVELFDDWLSFLHVPVGILSYYMPVLFVIFIFYEVIEFSWKVKELKTYFIGDFSEYCIGVTMAHLINIFL